MTVRSLVRGSWIRRCVSLVVVLLALASGVVAQVDTGAIVGRVTDASGAIVPGAQVVVKEESTGIETKATSSNDGEFILSPLKLGNYTVTVTKGGFKSSVREHVEVSIQSRVQVDASLQAGAVSETVEVTTAAPVLETQTNSIQQLVDEKAINDLPLNGRNASQLAQLSPGVTIAQNDTRGLQASGSFTANGASRTQNDYLLDGMDNNVAIGDLVNQDQFVIMPPPDALREFTVQTSSYTAEFGHAAGAVLNITTKSGGNAFHGDIWEYVRNDYFDATDFFVKQAAQRKPEFRLNQFGATLGGPISIPHLYSGKDRSFFFVDYQGSRRVQGQTYVTTVPTAAEQASNFTNLSDLIALQTGTTVDALARTFPKGTVMDPATTRTLTANVIDPVTGITPKASGTVRDPFYTGTLGSQTTFTGANAAFLNQIPAGRIDPVAVGLLHLYPAPINGNLTSNYTSSPAVVTNTDSMDARIDQQIGAKDSMFFRYSYVHTTQATPGPFPGVADGAAARPGTGYTEAQNGALSWTHILSAHLVNEARVGYSRIFDKRLQPNANTFGIPAQYGIPGIPQIAENGGLPFFSFGLMSSLGSAGTLPSDKASDVWQGTENLTIERGRHQIRTGFEYQHIAFPMATPSQARGVFTTAGTYTSVTTSTDSSTDRAQFVLIPQVSPFATTYNYLGGPNQLQATNFPPTFYPVRNYYGAYVQDSWRVTPNFTLNAGIRYEFIGEPSEVNGHIGNLVPAVTGDSPDGLSHYYIPQSQVPNLTAAFITALGANNIILSPTSDNAIAIAQKDNLAPRIGFAFQPTSRVSIRGGYGLFYQPKENQGISSGPYVDFPNQISLNYAAGNSTTAPTTDGSVGPASKGFSNISLTPASATLTAVTFNGEPRFSHTSYAMDFSLQAQYEIMANTVVFAGYVGSTQLHAQSMLNLNNTTQIVAPSVAAKTIQLFPGFAQNGTYDTHEAASNYNSLQFGGERRFSHGLSFIANMTWSKCLGNIRDLLDNSIGNIRAPFVPGMGMRADYSLCNTDSRRVAHAAGTYELPFGENRKFLQHGPASWVLGGWSMNALVDVADGQPVTVTCSSTTTTLLGCFSLQVPGVGQHTTGNNIAKVTHFLNAAAFTDPPIATTTSATTLNLGGPPTQTTGPAYRHLDVSLFRRIAAYRETYFEFRAECFNITNTPNFGQPGTLTATSSAFAKITTTRDNPNDPREIQLSGKFYF